MENPWHLPVPAEIIREFPPAALTDRWFEARRGRLTASRRAEIIEMRNGTKWRIMASEIDQEIDPSYRHSHVDAPAMRWGRQNERPALDAIQAALKQELTEPGLLLHPKYDFVGATPDGLVNGDTCIQVKCPYNQNNHMKTVLDNQIGQAYYCQVQWESWVSGRDNIIFASFDPRQPAYAQLHMIDIPVDKDMHSRFDAQTAEFAEYFRTRIFPASGRLSVESGIPTGLF